MSSQATLTKGQKTIPDEKWLNHLGWAVSFLLIVFLIMFVVRPSFEHIRLPLTIDFDQNPNMLIGLDGVYPGESWGRWTAGKMMSMTFTNKLPSRFSLEVIGRAFGPNIGKPFVVKIGNSTREMRFGAQNVSQRVLFEDFGDTNTIQIFVPAPTSPHDLGEGVDERKLGLGISRINLRPGYDEIKLPATVYFNEKPTAMVSIDGVYPVEPWGRWTEGNQMRLSFLNKIPQYFTLEIVAHAYGHNIGQPIEFRIGKIRRELKFTEKNEMKQITFNGLGEVTDSVIVEIPHPTSPVEFEKNKSGDERMLGLAITRITLR